MLILNIVIAPAENRDLIKPPLARLPDKLTTFQWGLPGEKKEGAWINPRSLFASPALKQLHAGGCCYVRALTSSW